MKKVRELSIKEMTLEEKNDSLLDSFILTMATDYALFSEPGELDRYYELSMKDCLGGLLLDHRRRSSERRGSICLHTRFG